jgi:predicted oxidoreductase
MNEPRLIISTHTPGIVNAFYQPELGVDHLDSIYLANPDPELTRNGIAQFARLSEKGKDKVKFALNTTSSETGDILFPLFAEKLLQKDNMELLVLHQTRAIINEK